jgi:hypothetical protein
MLKSFGRIMLSPQIFQQEGFMTECSEVIIELRPPGHGATARSGVAA